MRKIVSPLRFIMGREKLKFERQLAKIYAKAGSKLIYRTKIGIDTYVHPQKLLDIIRLNSSGDAEPWIRQLSSEIHDLDIALDVGANIGLVTCWLSKRARNVYAFEPIAENADFMKSNVELNGCRNVEIIESAIGETNGVVDIFKREAFGHHGMTQKHVSKTLEINQVPITRLDDFCRNAGIDHVSFLKIDVEGAEIAVLRGFRGFLSGQKVAMIVFEHAPALFDEQEQKAEVFDLLKSFGYAVFDLSGNPIGREHMLNCAHGDFYSKPA